MRKILIFLLCFCTLFLCFVIPSFADDGVTSRAVPTDLTGVTVTVPAGWSASAGLGLFYINGIVTVNGNTYYLDSTGEEAFGVGYRFDAMEGGYVSSANMVGMVWQGNITPSSSFVFEVTAGNDADNTTLIQWFVDNDATFSGGEPPTYTIPSGFYNLNSLPTEGVPSTGGFIVGLEELWEVPVELHYSSGAVKSYNYFGFVLTSFESSNNFSLDFTVQLLDIGTSIRIANLTAVDGVCTSQFYGGISRIYIGEDIVTDDEPSYQLFSFMFTADSAYLPDEPPVPDFTLNPWGYILEMIIDALKVPLFGYFSVWDIFVTICGIFILTWLLKLLAGG